MNIYNLLTEREKAKVDAFSQKVNTEKKTEPLFFKRQLISNYALQLFRENHQEQAEEIRRQQEKKNLLAQECIAHITWEYNIYGWDGEKKSDGR